MAIVNIQMRNQNKNIKSKKRENENDSGIENITDNRTDNNSVNSTTPSNSNFSIVCENSDTIDSIRLKLREGEFLSDSHTYVFSHKGTVVDESESISNLGEEIELTVEDTTDENTTVENTTVENTTVENKNGTSDIKDVNSTKDVNITYLDDLHFVRNGIKYRITNIQKKLTKFDQIKESLRKYWALLTLSVSCALTSSLSLLRSILTPYRINMLCLMLWLYRFNKQMFLFVIVISLARIVSRLIEKHGLMERIPRFYSIILIFFASVFMIDHDKFIKRKVK